MLYVIPKLKPRRDKLPNRLYQTIRERSVMLRGCYTRLLKRNPNATTGRLTFRINVDQEGNVTEVTLLKATFREPQVGRCAQPLIKRWRFAS